ncbi:Aste57867_9711 [Aphanomyces stellatus]|uniref:Aste57867_9711 protein n=1 Tax=Aphanomyces stellatus TaxID=120398 RepID=A0A485KNK8_9STRA|nr:hypothetical protein As57867_009673 [Aphanomyces stellatus]VFT86590.1 Aste57867_9711 [Aphanomyces stellatus]
MGLFSALSSSSRKYIKSSQTTSSSRQLHVVLKKEKAPSALHSSIRICSNLVAATLVLLSLVTVIVLLNTGMYHRHVIINEPTFDSARYTAYGQSCLVDADGFVANSCSDVEVSTTTPAAWTAVGGLLARQWLATSSAPYFVTTCLTGDPGDPTGWVALIFLAGYDAFPLCQPPGGPQVIAGMAMAETTTRIEHPDGLYMLTVFADQAPGQSVVHVNSDWTTDVVVSNCNQSLIDVDGITAVDLIGINTVEHAMPLGRRYMATGFSYEIVVDISAIAANGQWAWWNVGRDSNKAIRISWDTGHDVAHSDELIALQLILSLGALGLVSSDFYLTIQGLRGFLLRKPVMTYDLLAGLERRKLLLLVVSLGALPSLLYADVSRIYYETANGNLIWYLSTILVGIHVAFTSLFVVSLADFIPSISAYVLTFSPTLFAYSTILSVFIAWNSQHANVSNEYNNADFVLGLNISGLLRPSGAYTSDGIETAMSHMATLTFTIVVVCMLVSIAYSSLRRKLRHGTFFMHVAWTKTNSFLDRCNAPRYVSGLPLDQVHAIKIGNKLYCKPSTQAVLGFATLVNEKPPSESDDKVKPSAPAKDVPMTLVSVYHLVPSIWHVYRWLPAWLSPSVVGRVEKNQFKAVDKQGGERRLGQKRCYHHRGTCIN